MTLFEGILIFNLIILLFLAYQIGKLKSEVEVVYEGLAAVMLDHQNLKDNL